MSLMKIQYSEEPVEDFKKGLYQLYSFALGALFFEMATKIPLSKFIWLKICENQMKQYSLPDTEISSFLNQAVKEKTKYASRLIKSDWDQNLRFELLSIINQCNSPDLCLLSSDFVTSFISKKFEEVTPKFYTEMVMAMIEAKGENRISIFDALKTISEFAN